MIRLWNGARIPERSAIGKRRDHGGLATIPARDSLNSVLTTRRYQRDR